MAKAKKTTPRYINRKILVYKNNTIEVRYEIDEEESLKSAIEVNGKRREDISNISDYNSLEDYAYSLLREYYSEFFSQTFENLIVLTGAGSSKGIGKDKKGLLISEFWKEIEDYLAEEYKEGTLKSLCTLVDYNDENVEELLSKIFLLTSVKPNSKIKVDKEEIETTDVVSTIEKKICDLCNLKLPNNSPHASFLKKITKRKSSLPRVKLFTLNYDLLFEQAANEINAVLIDGFSFSYPRVFSGRNYDYDIVKRQNSRLKKDKDYLQRVIHLYKPHGSINWTKEENRIQIEKDSSNPLMIYPRDTKYEASYEQPFFEMMSRFQNSLRSENTTLVTIGFSFNDKHLVTAIIEAFNQNPSFTLVVIDPFFDNSSNEILEQLTTQAKDSSRIILIAESFENFAKHLPESDTYLDQEYEKIKLARTNLKESIQEHLEDNTNQ